MRKKDIYLIDILNQENSMLNSKNSYKKKLFSLVVTSLMIGIIIIGGTLALFKADTGSLNNVLNFGKVNIGVVLGGNDSTAYEHEIDPGNSLSQEDITNGIRIKNINLPSYPTSDTYVRVRLVAILRDSFGNGTGEEVKNLSFGGTDENWAKSGEYYYYKSELAPGEISKFLIDKVFINGLQLPSDGLVQGKRLEIQVLADGVMAKDAAVLNAWGEDALDVINN